MNLRILQNRKVVIGLLLCFSITHSTFGQRDVEEAIGTPYIGIHYGLNWTGGDLADKYGLTHAIGSHAGYKTKSNWVYGIEGNFFFGNDIRIEGLLQNLQDDHGNIMNTSGEPSIVSFFNRGFNINFTVSKIFPVWSPNPNSGIMIQLSAGYRWSRLRIEANDDEVPQIENDYKKGYDRLMMGANTSQFLGYSFMANRGIYNFYAGAYFQQTFMKNQRDVFWDHPNEKVNKDWLIGHLLGFRVGWLIPIYQRQPKEFYFN